MDKSTKKRLDALGPGVDEIRNKKPDGPIINFKEERRKNKKDRRTSPSTH